MSAFTKYRNSDWGFGLVNKVDPLNRLASGVVANATDPSVPHPPGVPNPNDAAQAAQATTDAMRQRRGLLSNIYAGAGSTQPVSGKTQLGS